MKWPAFKEKFLEKYFTDNEREKRELAFSSLQQGSMSVTGYQNQFEALARFAPHLIDTPERRARKFARGLTPSIRRMVIGNRQRSYLEIVTEALNLEQDNIEFKEEMNVKNQEKLLERREPSWKKQKMNHEDADTPKGETSSSAGTVPKCYHCGIVGHYARECTKSKVHGSTCFKCGESGHFARECKNPRKNFQPKQNAQGRLYAVVSDDAIIGEANGRLAQ